MRWYSNKRCQFHLHLFFAHQCATVMIPDRPQVALRVQIHNICERRLIPLISFLWQRFLQAPPSICLAIRARVAWYTASEEYLTRSSYPRTERGRPDSGCVGVACDWGVGWKKGSIKEWWEETDALPPRRHNKKGWTPRLLTLAAAHGANDFETHCQCINCRPRGRSGTNARHWKASPMKQERPDWRWAADSVLMPTGSKRVKNILHRCCAQQL